MVRMPFLLTILSAGGGATLLAQDTVVLRGVPSPEGIVATPVRDSSFVRLLNGIHVLAEGMVGIPGIQVRLLGAWGEWSGQDCDCVTTDVYVALNEDGETMALHRLPTLLDPVVDSLKTEQRQAVAYLTYGPGLGRRHVRLAIAMSGVRARRVP